MDIRECNTDQEILATYPVIKQLYGIPDAEYLAYIKEMQAVDYRIIAAYVEDKPVAVVGFRVGRRLYCGKYLHIDNLIIDNTHRGHGFARGLLRWLHKEAERLDCDTLLADSYVDNYPAQRLFLNEGYHIRGFHLKQNIKTSYRTTFVSDKPQERGC
jgi:ribosomal protein S18 acetylase RimI-like enzyme